MDIIAITKLLTSAGLIATMLAIGLKVRWGEVLNAAKQTRLVVLALVANFLLVPAVTVGLLWLLDADPMVAAGFLILAVCPGAPVGPLYATLAKSDVPSAIGLMVILAAMSAILSPLLLGVLLDRFCAQGNLEVNYFSIVQTLFITQILPLAIALGVHERAAKFATKVAQPLNAVANLLLLVVVVLLLATQYETLYSIRAQGWVGMLVLLATSLSIGWLCGGPNASTRATLAWTTGFRNAAVGLVIAAASFGGTAAGTAVVAYALVSILGTLACALIYGARATPDISQETIK